MKNKLRGLTMLETVLYIGLFSAILFIIVNFMLTTQEANTRNKGSESLFRSRQFITQHINYTFEISDSIDESLSVFDSDNGELAIIKDTTTKSYILQDSKILFDGTPISSSDILVERFYITPIYEDTELIGVKIDIDIRDRDIPSLTDQFNLLSTFR
jgi:competence protein ComGC